MNILAIGAHPDDIEFGCGGTLLQYVRAGHSVYLLILTSGDVGGDPHIRQKEALNASEFMGVKKVFWGYYRDTELTINRPLITTIEKVVIAIEPDIVFMNYSEDMHQDHRAAASAGISATRHIKEVLFYEVPSTQHFYPDIFVNIGEVLADKLALLKLHESQVNRTSIAHLAITESVEACALFRGFQGKVKYAEGFKALRVLRVI